MDTAKLPKNGATVMHVNVSPEVGQTTDTERTRSRGVPVSQLAMILRISLETEMQEKGEMGTVTSEPTRLQSGSD